MSLDVLPFGIAHHMALIPLLWLAILRWRGRDLGAAWWWIAGVYSVSWIADTAAHWVDPWLIGAVYPVSQGAIMAVVFLSRSDAMKVVFVLVVIGVIDGILHGTAGPDIMLRVVAWGTVIGILVRLRQLGRLRAALLVYFGAGLLAWMGYVVSPGWTSWSVYQLVRLAGIAMFCWASMKPVPRLTLV